MTGWITDLRFLLLGAAAFGSCSIWMPGESYRGEPPTLSEQERELRDRLRRHVEQLAGDIGERNASKRAGLEKARDYIAEQFRLSGYEPGLRGFQYRGQGFDNVEAVLAAGSSGESLVVGAHYDTVPGSPGANDNASGVAALLELARALKGRDLPLSVRFVAFPNEEAPYFNTGEGMGSVAYAKRFADPAREIRGMLSLESIGFYSDVPGSQEYPPLVGNFYPDEGNFIAFVGNLRSRSLVREAVRAFRSVATIPSEGAALPSWVAGVSWSDHRSFWEVGVPALMVTDTAPFRDPHYHLPTDTPERLDYEAMARVVQGLEHVIVALAHWKF